MGRREANVIFCADLHYAVVQDLAESVVIDVDHEDVFALEFLRHRQNHISLAAFKLMQVFFANLRGKVEERAVLADNLLRRFLRFLEPGVFKSYAQVLGSRLQAMQEKYPSKTFHLTYIGNTELTKNEYSDLFVSCVTLEELFT